MFIWFIIVNIIIIIYESSVEFILGKVTITNYIKSIKNINLVYSENRLTILKFLF